MNIQDWFPLGLTGLSSLQSKRLSRVFSNTTVQKHQFFCTQLSLYSHIYTFIYDYWKNPIENPMNSMKRIFSNVAKAIIHVKYLGIKMKSIWES